MIIEERRFATVDAAVAELADELASSLRDALAARGSAGLAVSGGRTPRAVFERLRSADVDWAHVVVTLTDERWVPADHPASNEGLVRSVLLRGRAAAAAFVPLFGGEPSPEAGRAACELRLRSLTLPFDAVYLGLGPDGHIASLFPGEPAVEVRSGFCVAVPETGGRLPRMSLTVPVLLNARRIFLLFAGKDKHEAWLRARSAGPAREAPVRAILAREGAPVYVLMAP